MNGVSYVWILQPNTTNIEEDMNRIRIRGTYD